MSDPTCEDDAVATNENRAMSHHLHSAEYVERKQQRYGHIRCPRCWLDQQQHRCICAQLRPLPFQPRFRFLVYMDHKEFLNPGDDAKLLLCSAPSQSSLYIYPHEDNSLVEAVRGVCMRISIHILIYIHICVHLLIVAQRDSFVCALFPGEGALCFEDFHAHSNTQRPTLIDSRGCMPMTIIVIDAVWRHARKMSKRLKEICPDVPHVQVLEMKTDTFQRKTA